MNPREGERKEGHDRNRETDRQTERINFLSLRERKRQEGFFIEKTKQ